MRGCEQGRAWTWMAGAVLLAACGGIEGSPIGTAGQDGSTGRQPDETTATMTGPVSTTLPADDGGVTSDVSTSGASTGNAGTVGLDGGSGGSDDGPEPTSGPPHTDTGADGADTGGAESSGGDLVTGTDTGSGSGSGSSSDSGSGSDSGTSTGTG